MESIFPVLLTQGPLGVISGIFIWLYLAERKRANTQQDCHTKQLESLRAAHYERLDGVRQAQISREQEVARTLDEYGRSVVEALATTEMLARELRRSNYERG